MKICPHCGKQFKTKHGLYKHIIICQLNNKDKEDITVLPSQKEMWLIIQKLY